MKSFTPTTTEPAVSAPPLAPSHFALIIGAMKSGTTSLFEILAQHPEIAAASVKEANFFSKADMFTRGLDWYYDLWDWDPATHRIALEASPSYTTYPARPGVPERIAAVENADFRFIYILRNPLDQIESNVRHTLYAGWGKSLDQGVPHWMMETVQYSRQLEEYLKIFPKERFLLLTLEEFSQQPDAVLRRVCAFLGVDAAFQFQSAEKRYNTGDVYDAAASWAKLVKKLKLIPLAKRLLPRSVHHRIRGQLTKLPAPKASLGRYHLTPAEKVMVIEQLADDLARLESVYGVPTQRDWSIHEGRLCNSPAH